MPSLANVVAKSDSLNQKSKTLLTSVILGEAALKAGKYCYSVVKNRRSYRIVIPGKTDLFTWFQKWMLEQVPDSKIHDLGATTVVQKYHKTTTGWGTSKTLKFWYRGGSTQRVLIDGHKVNVDVIEQSVPVTMDVNGTQVEVSKTSETSLWLTVMSKDGHRAVASFLDHLVEEASRQQTTPKFLTASYWGDWRVKADAPQRPMDSVILREGLSETLINDFSSFFRNEDKYVELGIPFHRGYLFYGPPGTGKTSVATALATHFKLNIYYVSLNDLSKDADLLNILSEIEPGSLLLLEDIDVLQASQDREKEKKKDKDKERSLSLSGLLNALDGVATPHGLIVAMTTNFIDRLDDAVIRPGRVDRRVHLDYVDDDQLARLVQHHVGRRMDLPPVTKNVTPAEIIEIFKRHLDSDVEAAVTEVKELLS